MPTPVKYLMKNEINGSSVIITGNGSLSDTGELDLHLTLSDTPLYWTGILVPCICSGPGPGNGGLDLNSLTGSPGLFAFSPRGYRTTPTTSRLATLYDHSGTCIAAVRATGEYINDGSGFDFNINVYTKTIKNPIMEDLRVIDHYSFSIHPVSKGRVLVIAHYGLSGLNGANATGWTNISYDLENQDFVLPQVTIGRNIIDIKFDKSLRTLSYISKQMTISSSDLGILF